MYDLRILFVWMVLGFLLYLIAIRPERDETKNKKKNANQSENVNERFGWDREFTKAEKATISKLRECKFLEKFDSDSIQISSEPMGLLPKDLMMNLGVAPLRVDDDVLVLAMVDPFDLNALDVVRGIVKREIKPVIIAEKDFSLLIGKYPVD